MQSQLPVLRLIELVKHTVNRLEWLSFGPTQVHQGVKVVEVQRHLPIRRTLRGEWVLGAVHGPVVLRINE